jgi:hypothetical protein
MRAPLADRSDPESTPLLAHELTHVAGHLGASDPQPAPALTLAQRHAPEEQVAERVERTIARQFESTAKSPMEMPLARATTAATPAAVQRAETVASPPPPADANAEAEKAVSPEAAAKMAEQVYSLIERRLLIERERSGFRR